MNETTKHLEEAEKEEWSEDTSALSALCTNVFGNNYLDELVLSPTHLSTQRLASKGTEFTPI